MVCLLRNGLMMKKPETGRIAIILLAAGPSSRLGQAKQLVRFDGESLVRRAARVALSLEPDSITVVTGFADKEVEHELRDLPVRLVRNDEWAQGMGGSIACGVRSVSEQVDGVLVMLCDQWRIEKDDLVSLILTWLSDISRVIVASWYEQEDPIYGAPVLFPRKYIRELRKLNGNRGAKALIDQNLEQVQFVELKNAACDLDRPEDLEQLLKRS